jgi:hypothetical protein
VINLANSIVFQSSADQLKTAVYGSDGTKFYPIKTNSSGELQVNVGEIKNIGTLKDVINVGTLNKVKSIDTLSKVVTLGTLKDVTNIGTLNKVKSIDTLSKVVTLGTLKDVTNVGTLSKVTTVSTLNKITSTVKVNLVDKTFTNDFKTIRVNANSSTYSTKFDVSKYQDTSWYLRNITNTTRRLTVTIQLAVTPSITLSKFPRVLVKETATIKNNAKVITNDYFMKYMYLKVSNPTNTTQTISVAFNGRY